MTRRRRRWRRRRRKPAAKTKWAAPTTEELLALRDAARSVARDLLALKQARSTPEPAKRAKAKPATKAPHAPTRQMRQRPPASDPPEPPATPRPAWAREPAHDPRNRIVTTVDPDNRLTTFEVGPDDLDAFYTYLYAHRWLPERNANRDRAARIALNALADPHGSPGAILRAIVVLGHTPTERAWQALCTHATVDGAHARVAMMAAQECADLLRARQEREEPWEPTRDRKPRKLPRKKAPRTRPTRALIEWSARG